ncbi:hypothetical protein AMTR_s00177p00042850 [Amborella trichopoda]|uniref:Uncharacterized protein n=1 Tax=Amborella trichopoda TaxID=13333 RepID=W1PQG5_AMBTC|nr:hypothetical protein AMTR_s00177p00042850 [Amborella trichopoda]
MEVLKRKRKISSQQQGMSQKIGEPAQTHHAYPSPSPTPYGEYAQPRPCPCPSPHGEPTHPQLAITPHPAHPSRHE